MSCNLPLRAVANDPDIRGDAGVVEHVGRQADDGFDKIVLQQVAADVALTRTRSTCEEWRAVEHNAETAAAVLCRARLGEEMQEK
jgi:hypothetical protein